MPGKAASLSIGGARRVRRQGVWRLLILLFIIFIIGCYISPVRSYIERSRQIENERNVTEQLRFENESLIYERESLKDENFVEQVAREDLGLVMPGEQSYVVKDLNSDQDAATDPLVSQDQPDGDETTTQAQPEASTQQSGPLVESLPLIP